MATAQIYDVFLCHATENREVVERVKSALEREVPARIFLNSIVPGGGILAEIERAVKEAAVGVFFVSEAFIGKQWPMRELDLFYNNADRLIDQGCLILIPVFIGVAPESCKNKGPALKYLSKKEGIIEGTVSAMVERTVSSVVGALKQLGRVPSLDIYNKINRSSDELKTFGYKRLRDFVDDNRRGVNTKAADGRTALHVCAERGHGRATTILKDCGANVNLLNNSGKTPLQVAIERGNEHAMKALTD